MGETRSPIFLKMIIANAQNMAERSEHISPMYGIAVNYYLKNEVKFREIYYLLYNKIIWILLSLVILKYAEESQKFVKVESIEILHFVRVWQ